MWEHLPVACSLCLFGQATPEYDWTMTQFLFHHPWLIVVSLALLIPIVAIVVGTITDYLRKTRIAEIDAALKREMLEKGMTAEQIKVVLEASSTTRKHKHGGCA